MITPEPPAGSEHYREGWRHGYEQAAIDRERSADAVRLVPESEVQFVLDDNERMLAQHAADVAEIDRLRSELDHADHFGRGEFRVTSWAYEQVCRTDREKGEKIADLMREVAELRAGAVPDTGQAREQILQRDITFGAYVIAVCDAIGLPHDSPRAAVVEAIRAAVAAAQAPESPTDSPPKAGRGGSSEAETASGGRAPDVAAADLDRWLYETFTRHGTAARWARLDVDDRAYWTRKAAEIRALLGTDTTPDRLAWISKAGETASAERQARYQETACARRPSATSGDPAQPDLAYARSEVDKWLASSDPYCILPTRTEHIPALLARLDELEGTR